MRLSYRIHYCPPDHHISPQNVLGTRLKAALRACERVMLTSRCRPRFTSSPHYGWSCLSSRSSRSMHREYSVFCVPALPVSGVIHLQSSPSPIFPILSLRRHDSFLLPISRYPCLDFPGRSASALRSPTFVRTHEPSRASSASPDIDARCVTYVLMC